MNIFKLKEEIDIKLSRNISSKIFLDNLIFYDEDIRNSNIYLDSKYYPFYAWLGSLITPKNFLDFSFGQGITSSCFFKACKSVINFLGFQEYLKDYNSKIGIANVKINYSNNLDVYIGNIYDEEFEEKSKNKSWDLISINNNFGYDKYRNYFDFSWEILNKDGYLIVDNTNNKYCYQAIKDFCKVKRQEFCKIDTRYGVCILQK